MKRPVTRVGRVDIKKFKNRHYYPTIFCLKEEKTIGLSYVRIMGKCKVNMAQWRDDNSKFLDGYKIDMTQYSDGEQVICPKCGSPVDFRLYMSDTRPELK